MHKDMLSMSLGDFEEKYPKEMYLRRDKVIATRFAHAIRNTGRFEGDLKERNIWIWGETGLGKSRWAESNGTSEVHILNQKSMEAFLEEFQYSYYREDDIQHFTKLHYAAVKNYKEIAEQLISEGADINAKDRDY